MTASAGGGQLTATSFDRVVGAFDRMGVTIDARDVSLALAALAAQSDPATGSGSTTANDVPAQGHGPTTGTAQVPPTTG